VSQTARDPSQIDWLDELRRALATGGGRVAGRSLFHEAREDLAVAVGPGGQHETIHTQVEGVCLDDPATPARLTYASSPCSEDPSRLARGDEPLGASATEESRCTTLQLDATHALAVAERLQALAQTTAGAARVTVRWVSFVQRIAVARDDGLAVSDSRAGWRVRLDGRIDREERNVLATVEAGRGTPLTVDDPRLSSLAQSLVVRLLHRREEVPPPSGLTTVILAPGVGGVLAHEIFGHALEADVYSGGRNWLASLPVGSVPQDLVVADDPRRCRAPIRVDDEGTQTSETVLVANGRIVSCLHDRSTASRMGVCGTGHGRRASFRDPVRPRMAGTFIGPGSVPPDELLRGVSDGVLVHRMEAGFTDTRTGRSVFRVVDADRIRGGAIEAAAEPHVLEIDARRALSGLRIGDDLAFDTSIGSCHRDGQTLITSVGAPTVCIGMAGVAR
jgi:TldD protein